MTNPQDNIFFKGDTIVLTFQLWADKQNNVYYDLTNHQIRFQLNHGITPIKKATANVSGGSDSQIHITTPTQGIFTVTILKTESDTLTPADYTFEIEITTPTPASQRYTVLQSSLRILQDYITWVNE